MGAERLIDTECLLQWTGYVSVDQLERFLRRQNIRYAKTAGGRLVTTQAAIDACFMQLPGNTEDDELIRSAEVEKLTGLNRVAIYRQEKDGKFPNRVQIGPRSVAWKRSEIIAWVEKRRLG
ncbi:helix-turn-helix transcriptional regulator [Endozoicomonas atrinae]|uniref:helix-turn-helix transcriptional regulator n=1 Tax=Endozoicomonas atrinae TaxID=1333660 RepID=UPI000ACAEA76|nr:AlpA family phage regulatory protein [Endozoicomonas atrinae]